MLYALKWYKIKMKWEIVDNYVENYPLLWISIDAHMQMDANYESHESYE